MFFLVWLIFFSLLWSGVMALDLLLIPSLHWNQRKRNQYIRVNGHLVLHALLAQNWFGGLVLADTLGQREWLVSVFLLAIDEHFKLHASCAKKIWGDHCHFNFTHKSFIVSCLCQVVCSDKTQFSCENLCGNLLSCDNHYCTKTCHAVENLLATPVQIERSESCEECHLPCQKVVTLYFLLATVLFSFSFILWSFCLFNLTT